MPVKVILAVKSSKAKPSCKIGRRHKPYQISNIEILKLKNVLLLILSTKVSDSLIQAGDRAETMSEFNYASCVSHFSKSGDQN